MTDPHKDVLRKLWADRPLAHEVIFARRHDSATPEFHRQMILDWHSGAIKNLCDIVFRGGAKSTIGEEAIIIMALFREFDNCIIFGSSFERAAQRLHAIRREFEKNEKLQQLFGDMRGTPWSDEKLELSNGRVIQAMGRGQALRGTKEEIKRPDLVFADDIEDIESVRTPEARDKIQSWFLSEVLPAMDPKGRTRVAANDLDPECLANKLKGQGSGFVVKVYPWEYLDAAGARRATWEARFPLGTIDEKKKQMVSLGRLADYNKEYMCRSTAPEDKPFKPDMFRVEAKVRTWEATYAMFDPARTVGRNSATTGFACWSWIANRLIVWDAWAKYLLPDEIISEVFACAETYSPVWVGVEEDGLNQWLLQPIRQEMVRRGITLPLKAMKAPKGKLDFIRGLQPFFNAREVVFAQDLPDLKKQFQNFPTGEIDAPNALAYALKMRAGVPMYDDFSGRNVLESIAVSNESPPWLCINAIQGVVSAVFLQLRSGSLRILNDWVREGEPATCVHDIITSATLEAGRMPRVLCGPTHFDRFNNLGLVQALKAVPVEVRNGGDIPTGRATVRSLMRQERQGIPMVLVSHEARWTLNGFAGGYARALLKGGMLAEYPEEGVYRCVMEAIESFMALVAAGSPEEEEDDRRYAFTADGRRYATSLGRR